MSIANPDTSILRKNPYAKRRSFIARMNPLSPIGDIANATLTESGGGTGGPLTWETASDWDSAVSEAGVVHESYGDLVGAGTIQLGYPSSSPDPTNIENHYHLHEDSGTTAEDISGNNRDGTYSVTSLGNGGIFNTTAPTLNGTSDFIDIPDDPITSGDWTVLAWVYITDLSHHNTILSAGVSGGAVDFRILSNSNFYSESIDGPYQQAWNGSLNEWEHVAMKRSGSTIEAFTNGTPMGTASGTIQNSLGDWEIGDIDAFTQPLEGRIAHPRLVSAALSDSAIAADHDDPMAGSITTATKSFSTAVSPNLQNLSYSLNSQSVTLDVIGSPGTGSEEIVTQALDGATSYSLTWSNTHTDYRIKIEPSTTDPTTSPTVGRVELAAP